MSKQKLWTGHLKFTEKILALVFTQMGSMPFEEFEKEFALGDVSTNKTLEPSHA